MTLAANAAAQSFRHPGVLVSREQLDFLKGRIAAGAQPWKAAADRMRSSSYASLSYTPKPRAVVECGSYSNPNYGCSDERNDAVAAYTHALLWHLTGNAAHAQKAIAILNAWSATIQSHTNSNAPLQSAWAASIWPRAAEILRHTGAGWAAAEVARFASMLRNAYIPYIQNGSGANGNWELSMIEALMHCAVFLDDRPLFDKALSMWRKRVPAYFYLTTDGPLPVPPPSGNKNSREALIGYWHGQTTFVDGLAQETCRDFGHTQYGIAAAVAAAETAWLQGVDLYGEQSRRLTAALEFHAGYLNGATVPSWLCGGRLNLGTNPTWEIAYNHFRGRRGQDLPQTQRFITGRIRPAGVDHHMAWETLTHAETGAAVSPILRLRTARPHPRPALVFEGGAIRLRRPAEHSSGPSDILGRGRLPR